MNHTRARARSPRRAGPGRAVAVAEAEARRGAARPAGRTGGARAHARARPDVTCRCGAVRRGAVRCDGYFAVDSN